MLITAAYPVACAFVLDDNGYVRSVNAPYDDTYFSKDGKYIFYIDKDTNEIGFVGTNEKDITVLEVPEEIDGYTVTSICSVNIKSPSVTRIKLPDSLLFLNETNWYAEPVPVCMVDLNEGLESISHGAGSDIDYYPLRADEGTTLCDNTIHLKTLILPSTLKYIGSYGITRGYCENIIFQSNPVTDLNSITYWDSEAYYDKYNTEDPLTELNCYFTGDATNLSEFTFNRQIVEWKPFGLDELYEEPEVDYPETFPSKYVTLYKKPNAQGFEKFTENYDNIYINERTGGMEIPEYTVKEYTEEWWHDLAEIEEVTMTAEGMSEKTEQVGNVLSDSARKYLSHEYEKSVKSGEKFTVSSAFAPSDAYDDRTFFVSMDETVATVDTETGEVTALKKGTARIRCVAASGVFSDCILKVDGGDNTNGICLPTKLFEYATDANQTKTVPDSTANQTKPTDWKEFFFANKLYIIIPVAAAAILTAAVIVIKKKKR